MVFPQAPGVNEICRPGANVSQLKLLAAGKMVTTAFGQVIGGFGSILKRTIQTHSALSRQIAVKLNIGIAAGRARRSARAAIANERALVHRDATRK
ncbi:MAG: hypothetical protein P4N60_05065 [Verrucomicrobiae bacterium]|nr:hypothetical protein [Verrucomicrobiae bacterium]